MTGQPEIVPRAEAVHAAGWWASRLGTASQRVTEGRDAAERESQAFTLFASAMSQRTFTDGQRAAFAAALAPAIELHLREWETGVFDGAWCIAEPKRGSAVRCISIDYAAHPVLMSAAEAAGITLKTLDLPLKTVMWINPGEVIVSEGYGAPPADAWRGEPSPAAVVASEPPS